MVDQSHKVGVMILRFVDRILHRDIEYGPCDAVPYLAFYVSLVFGADVFIHVSQALFVD
jgi:hypothetical protein